MPFCFGTHYLILFNAKIKTLKFDKVFNNSLVFNFFETIKSTFVAPVFEPKF
jgi:hypothetical protein